MINREQWENLWNNINDSVKNWRSPESKNYSNKGDITFDGHRIEWHHHYSKNYEGVPFNSIAVYHYLPNEIFAYEKIWKKEGSGVSCDISASKIKSLKENVEKYLKKMDMEIC